MHTVNDEGSKTAKTRAKDVLPNKKHAGHRNGQKMPFFVPGDLDLLPSTLTFKLVQTRLPCEFGTYPFSGSRDISYTNKKVQGRRKQNVAQIIKR